MTITRTQWILYAVIAALVILVILLLSGVFGSKAKGNDYFDLWMKEKEAKEQLQAEIRQKLENQVQTLNAEKDSLMQRLADNQPKYIINERRLQDVPTRYVDISKDDLRRRAINY